MSDKNPVTVAIHYSSYGENWQSMLQEQLEGFSVRLWPDWGDLDDVDYAVVWTPPHGLLQKCSNLKAIFCIGAGVDQLLVDPDFPRQIPLVRMTDAVLEEGMAEYITLAVLSLHRDLLKYLSFQGKGDWHPLAQRFPKDQNVGIMGLGNLGMAANSALQPFGFQMSGWSRSKKQIEHMTTYAGMETLPNFLKTLDILIVLLPLTDETRGILNAETLSLLPEGANVINAARGALLEIEDARQLLDQGLLGYLWLDVHHVEPLSQDHWTWSHPRVVITPHIAAATLPGSASNFVATNILRMEQGSMPSNVVEISAGY